MLAAIKRQLDVLTGAVPGALIPLPSAQPFDRKVVIDFTMRHYRVKTIDTARELSEVLALRQAVFHVEFAKKWLSLSSDRSEYDDVADHLAIYDESVGRIVGVYRIIATHFSPIFYSATEFDISHFLKVPGRKIELSRACIAPEYRTGAVISLLWRGLADYATKVQADYIFGLSSVTTMDLRQIAALTIYFEEMGLMDHGFGITPLPRYWLRDLGEMLTECRSSRRDLREIEAKIPSLLKSYLKAGAKVCSFPVIDRQFKCTDFFTVLEMTKLSSAHGRRFAKT